MATKGIKTATKMTTKKATAVKKKSTKTKLIVDYSQTVESEPWQTKRGRPKIFDPQKAIDLMEGEIEKYFEKQGTDKFYTVIPLGENSNVLRGRVDFLTIEEIALICGTTYKTLNQEATALNDEGGLNNEQLSETYERYKIFEKTMLQKGAMTGAYPQNIATFLLSANHGLTPKTATESKVETNAKVELKAIEETYRKLDEIYTDDLMRVNEQEEALNERRALLDKA